MRERGLLGDSVWTPTVNNRRAPMTLPGFARDLPGTSAGDRARLDHLFVLARRHPAAGRLHWQVHGLMA